MTDETECHYCHTELGELGNARSLPVRTVDHIVPRSLGGVDERFNKVWSCQSCNNKKADSWPTCTCNRCRRARRLHTAKGIKPRA